MTPTEIIQAKVQTVQDALERVHELEQLIIHARAKLNGAISDLVGSGDGSTVEGIIARVAHYYRVPQGEMLSRSRTAEVAWSRMVAMRFTREFTRMSSATIGRAFGRDHGTVLCAVKTVDDRVKTDPAFRHEFEQLRRQLQEDAMAHSAASPTHAHSPGIVQDVEGCHFVRNGSPNA